MAVLNGRGLLVARIARLAGLPRVARLAGLARIAGLALVARVTGLACLAGIAWLALVARVARLALERIPAGAASVGTGLAAFRPRASCNIFPAVGPERGTLVALRKVAMGLPAHCRTCRLGRGLDLKLVLLLGNRLR